MQSRISAIKERVKEKYRAATGVGTAAFVVAVAMVAGMLVPVIWALTDINSPAFYRVTLLVFNGMFAMSIGSVFADMEMFDFWTALILGVILAIPANIALLVAEGIRWANCGSSTIATNICNNFSSEVSIVPIIAIVETGLSLLALVLLFMWRSRKASWQADYTEFVEKTTKKTTVTQVEAEVEVAEGEESEPVEGSGVEEKTLVVPLSEQQTKEKRLQMIHKNRKSGTQVALAVIGVIMFITMLAVGGAAVALLLFEDQVSFYRGYFLILPAHYAAAEFSFLAHVPRGWRTVYLVFSFFSLASSAVGAYFEVTRMADCLNGAPIGQVDTDICNNEYWSRLLMPIALLIVALFSLASFIIHIFLAFEKSEKQKREVSRRRVKHK